MPQSPATSLTLMQKATLMTVMAVLFGGAVQWVVQDRGLRRQAVASLQRDLDGVVTRNGLVLADLFDRTRRDLVFLANAPATRNVVAGRNGVARRPGDTDWDATLADLFLAFSRSRPDYDQIRLIGLGDNGRERVRIEQGPQGPLIVPPERLQSKGDRDYFIATTKLQPGEIYVSDINLNRERGEVEVPHKPTLRAAMPIHADDGTLFGILVINRNMARPLDALAHGTAESAKDDDEKLHFFLTNAEGDFISHPDPARSFGFDLGQRHRWQDEFDPGALDEPPEAIRGADIPLRTVGSPLGTLHLATGRVAFDPRDPQRYLVLTYAATDARIDRLVATAHRSQLAADAGVLILLLLVVGLGMRRITGPVRRLTAVADQVAGGNFELDTISHMDYSTGEVGKLQEALHRMLREVHEREQRVRQLNAELAERVAEAGLIFDSSPDGVLLVDGSGCIVQANRRACEMFGYPGGDLVGQTVEALMPERLRGQHVEHREGYVRAPAARSMGQGRDLHGRRRDGSEFPVELSLAPIRYGNASHVIVGAIDITARKQAQDAIRHSEAQLRSFVEQAPVSIAMFDRDMRYIVTSRRWASEYGRGRQDLTGLGYYDIHPDPPAYWREVHRRGLDGETIENEDDQWTQEDGSRRWLRWAVHPWRNLSGEVGGIIIYAEDITERRLAEGEIHRLNTELEQRVIERTTELRAANQELEAFSYAVAHDLRAPLRAMNGFSAALQEDHAELFTGDAAACLEEITEGSRRMSELIDGLLALSRATQRNLERRPVDLTAIARRICGELARGEPQRRVDWQVEDGLSARGDPRMIEIVLYNLLGNAWKYTARTADAQIRLTATIENDEACFCVADNGAGFDMRHAEKLFAPFQRLHRRDEFPGIGIGLATVQRIIHRHGGHIRAHSAPGRGTHFCFTIESPSSSPKGGADE